MNAEIDDAVALVMLGFPSGTSAEHELRSLVTEAESVGCANLASKLIEFKEAATGGRLGALCAELRFAILLAPLVAAPPEFHTADAADIRFTADGVVCLLEVVHKSAPHPLSTVLNSEPALLASYATATDWKGAAHRLDAVLQSLPIAVQPWVSGELLKNQIGGREREKQELACSALADWLASELPSALARGATRLSHPDGVTYFGLTQLETTPGYMRGTAAVDAWFVGEGAFRQSIENKASKASARLQATGAGCYLIGLDIEDAFASSGHDIVSAALGPLFCRGGSGTSYSYRPVAPANQSAIEDAERRGRADLLKLALFDRLEHNSHGTEAGLYFESSFVDVSAILGLYYTNAVTFVPNPFSRTNIEPICQLFPATLAPIPESELSVFKARAR